MTKTAKSVIMTAWSRSGHSPEAFTRVFAARPVSFGGTHRPGCDAKPKPAAGRTDMVTYVEVFPPARGDSMPDHLPAAKKN